MLNGYLVFNNVISGLYAAFFIIEHLNFERCAFWVKCKKQIAMGKVLQSSYLVCLTMCTLARLWSKFLLFICWITFQSPASLTNMWRKMFLIHEGFEPTITNMMADNQRSRSRIVTYVHQCQTKAVLISDVCFQINISKFD